MFESERWAGTRPSRPGARDADPVQDDGEVRAVAALSGGDHDGEHFLALLDRQVQLAGPATAGAAQAVVGGFVHAPPGGSFCAAPSLRAPAACWWARVIVESIETSQAMAPAVSARIWSLVRICAQVPVALFVSACRRPEQCLSADLGPEPGEHAIRVAAGAAHVGG